MSGSSDKKDINWEAGEVIDNKSYDAVGGIRDHGLPKVNKALPADPKMRKEERDQVLLNQQSKPYQSKTTKTDDGTIIIEETQSGLKGDLEDSKAKKLIDRGKKFRGFDRFGDKKDES